MRSLALFALLLSVATLGHAEGGRGGQHDASPIPPPPTPPTTAEAQSNADARARVGDVSADGGSVGNVTADGGSVGNVTAGAGEVGDVSAHTGEIVNKQVIQGGETNIDYDYKRNAPAFGSVSIQPTNPCYKTGGVTLSLPAFGGSAGGGKVDVACEERETARIFGGFGYISLGKAILCASAAVERTIGAEECENFQRDPVDMSFWLTLEREREQEIAHEDTDALRELAAQNRDLMRELVEIRAEVQAREDRQQAEQLERAAREAEKDAEWDAWRARVQKAKEAK